MRRTPTSLLFAAAAVLGAGALTVGCMPTGGVNAPLGSSVSVSPGSLVVGNGPMIWYEDNVGLIEFADVSVSLDASPLENIKVEVKGPSSGTFLIPQQAIEAVDYPYAPEDFKSQRDEVCVDENGEFDNTEDWCAWYYDGVSGSYYDLGQSYADGEGADDDYVFRPSYHTGVTDGRGIMRFWYFVDAMPVADVGSGETDSAGNTLASGLEITGEYTFYVTIGVDSTTLVITSDG
jgi:hypothetical protein